MQKKLKVAPQEQQEAFGVAALGGLLRGDTWCCYSSLHLPILYAYINYSRCANNELVVILNLINWLWLNLGANLTSVYGRCFLRAIFIEILLIKKSGSVRNTLPDRYSSNPQTFSYYTMYFLIPRHMRCNPAIHCKTS